MPNLFNRRFIFFSPAKGAPEAGGGETPEGYREAYEEAPGEYKDDPYGLSADTQKAGRDAIKKSARNIPGISDDEFARMSAELDSSEAEFQKSHREGTETSRKPYSNEDFKTSLSPDQMNQMQALRDKAYQTQSPADWNKYQDAVINTAYANGFIVPERIAAPWKEYSDKAFFASLDVNQAFDLRNLRNDAVNKQDEGQWNAYLDQVAALAAQKNFTKPPRPPMPTNKAEANA